MKINDKLLSIFEEDWNLITLPFSDKEIECKAYTHKAVKNIIQSAVKMKDRKKGHVKQSLNTLRNLVQSCIKPDETGEPIDVRNLLIGDFTYVMLYLKTISSPDKSKYKAECANDQCKFIYTIDFDIETLEFLNKENLKNERKIDLKQNSNVFSIEMGEYTFNTMLDNADLFGAEIETGDEITKFYCSFINSIIVGDTVFESNDLNVATKMAFLDKLSDNDLLPLVKYIEEQPKLFWKTTFECPICGEKNELVLENTLDFFS